MRVKLHVAALVFVTRRSSSGWLTADYLWRCRWPLPFRHSGCLEAFAGLRRRRRRQSFRHAWAAVGEVSTRRRRNGGILEHRFKLVRGFSACCPTPLLSDLLFMPLLPARFLLIMS